jgi:hypothetical protein
MTTRAKWVNQATGGRHLVFYDSVTNEFLDVVGASAKFYDDFLGKYENVYDAAANSAGIWTEKITGAAPPTAVMLDSAAGGVMSFNLTADNQKQEAGIYFADYENFNIDKGVIAEFRAAVHTTPTGQAELYFGLANAYVEGPIAEADAGPTVHALFCYDGAITPTVHTDDTSNDNNAKSTGVTSVLDTYEVFRIEILSAADVRFYIDGTRVASSTTFDMSTGSDVVLQPFIMAHKETGVGVGALYVDSVKVWQMTR